MAAREVSPSASDATGTARGATPIGGRRRPPLWPLLALALLALVAVALFSLLRKKHDDSADKSARKAATSTTSQTSGGGASDATLTAKGVSLLPPSASTLRDHSGDPVKANGVTVQAPLARLDGIFVGDSKADSIYVELADTKPNGPTRRVSDYTEGDKVDFTGKLVANTPEFIAEAREDKIPDIDKIVSRGYHIEALPDDVTAA